MKYLDVKNMQQLADFAHKRYFVKLRPGETFEDLFIPTFWSYHKNKIEKYDIVRVVAHDDSFDVDLTAVDIPVGGIVMKLRPLFGGLSGTEALEAASHGAKHSAMTIVPLGSDNLPVVRVEHLAATGWRVIGLRGEVSRDHKSEEAATAAMMKYLKQAHLEFPNAEQMAAQIEAARIKSLAVPKPSKPGKAA